MSLVLQGRSQTLYTDGCPDKYLPLPQPMSVQRSPGFREDRKSTTRGHGECLVSLKCSAMLSYTWRREWGDTINAYKAIIYRYGAITKVLDSDYGHES